MGTLRRMSSRLVLLEQHPGRTTDYRALDTGITVLAVCLMLVSFGVLARMPLNEALLHIVLTAAFAFLLFYGMVEMYRWGPLGRAVWMLGSTAVWVADMTVSPVAVYWFLCCSSWRCARLVTGWGTRGWRCAWA